MNRLYKIRVKGRVQGVFYRASTKKEADEFGLKGWVKNEPNGDVSIEVTGPEVLLEQFVEWCWQGPIRARVDKLDLEEGEWRDFDTFDVVR